MGEHKQCSVDAEGQNEGHTGTGWDRHTSGHLLQCSLLSLWLQPFMGVLGGPASQL